MVKCNSISGKPFSGSTSHFDETLPSVYVPRQQRQLLRWHGIQVFAACSRNAERKLTIPSGRIESFGYLSRCRNEVSEVEIKDHHSGASIVPFLFQNAFFYSITDICIGGIFPTEEILKYSSMSVTYGMDDLTMCVQNAGMMPMVFAQLHAISATVWFLAIFGYGYSIGFLLFLLVQFDRRYNRRNQIDWHHTTWLITLPAIIGLSPNFYPIKGTVRILYAFTLISAFFAFQVAFTRSYDVLYIQIPLHQVSSLNESIDEDYHLSGTSEALHLLSRNQMVTIK